MTETRAVLESVRAFTLMGRAGMAILLSCILLGGAAYASSNEANDVAQSMRAIWDRPDAPLTVDPIVVEGDYALAGWTQQARGGRALLVRRDGRWQVHVCGGDGLKNIEALKMAGMSEPAARRLAEAANKAEAKLPERTREKFASFGQNVLVNGGHAPH